jgi:hypothetical protein
MIGKVEKALMDLTGDYAIENRPGFTDSGL